MKWKIDNQFKGMILRNYLHKELGISRTILKAIKYDGGEILINKKQVDVRYRLQGGETLTLKFPPEERSHYMQAEAIQLSVYFEDEHLLIINKPAGIVSMPTPHTPKGTIANGVIAYYDEKELPYTVHIVTRLDKDTSGLMLIAKHRYSHSLLALAQQSDGIKRSYMAIVQGEIVEKKGTINRPIGRKEGSFIEREVTERGREAITHYEVIEEVNGLSVVKVELETGRTHQIRVHFASLGHPIVGDSLYGGKSNLIPRQALHCHELSLLHPMTGERIHLRSDLPADMKALLKK